jgi:nicotinamidase-related amidase
MRGDVALLIVDQLDDVFERSSALATQRAALVGATKRLTAAIRRAGQPVIWVRQELTPALSDAFLDLRRGAGTHAGTHVGTGVPACLDPCHHPSTGPCGSSPSLRC